MIYLAVIYYNLYRCVISLYILLADNFRALETKHEKKNEHKEVYKILSTQNIDDYLNSIILALNLLD